MTKGNYAVKLVRGPFVRLDEHPDATHSEEEFLELCTRERALGPLAADLFCGAGGMSLGLAEAGFRVVLGADYDADALETHSHAFPGWHVDWDLSDDSVVERIAHLICAAEITLVAGGPPCQPFSRAGRSLVRELVRTGRRNKHDQRRDLWESFMGVVELARPPAVVMENVPDMALDRGMVILRAMIERFESLGYSVEERVVDTWRYGVPQFRQRLILVALADAVEFTWPEEAEDRITVANAIGDLPAVEGGWRPSNGEGDDPVASGWIDYEGPKTEFQRKARSSVSGVNADRVFDQITRPVREDDALAFAQMDHRTRYSDLDPELKRYRDDIFDDKYKRLDPNDVSRTITAHIAKDGYWYIHPFEDRTLTVREAARLQTFPDSFRFAGPPTAAFRQIGNAVPPALAAHIGEAVATSLAHKKVTRLSTGEVADRLRSWFVQNRPARLPWLAATERWQVIQAELLWERISDDAIRSAWAAVKELQTPEDTLEALPLLRRLAALWDREQRCDELEACAVWFRDNPEALSADSSASDLMRAPHVGRGIADLACRVVPGDAEDPVLMAHGVLRLAARFQGDIVDRQNRRSDGRLAIARLIGGDEASHEAHLALIELAAGICGPREPECAMCPLEIWCVEAANRPVQRRLTLTNPNS